MAAPGGIRGQFRYVNWELGRDIDSLFADIRFVGRLENPLARERGIGMWLCLEPDPGFLPHYSGIVAELRTGDR